MPRARDNERKGTPAKPAGGRIAAALLIAVSHLGVAGEWMTACAPAFALDAAPEAAVDPASLRMTEEDQVTILLLGTLLDDTEFDPLNPMIPDPDARELERMAEVLRLDEQQREVVENLLRGAIEAAFTEAFSVFAPYVDRLRAAEEGTPEHTAIMREMAPSMLPTRTRMLSMLTIFKSDLESTLDATQMERWPLYVAGVLRREHLDSFARPLGARADLFLLAEEIAANLDNADLRRVVDQHLIDWSRESDLLTRRLIRLSVDEMNDDRGRFSDDPDIQAERDRRHTERWNERLRVVYRAAEHNLRYYELIRSTLPAEPATRFERLFHREVLPIELARSRATVWLESILRTVPDLTPRQRSDLARVQEEHITAWIESVRQVIAVDRRIEDVMNRDPVAEPRFWTDPPLYLRLERHRQEMGDPGALDDEGLRSLIDLIARRQTLLEQQVRLNQSVIEQVRGVLTAEQMALHAPPPVRPPIELLSLVDDLRSRIEAGALDGTGPHELEFEGGVVRVENRLAIIEYDDIWRTEKRPIHLDRVIDLDWSDNITPSMLPGN